ncbi:hypothetical protein LHYA1_G000946 [Lachnellula hyalina]|uniref:DUF1763-domain-containing protein n=1 Tax=Lachnellula hyalina TaxID=1316788 RepID=A0A8H8R760_9HELO|nr:uncharacterized protein LHYA1_G000946 [Lachnellula hyalina]TVY29704.1 hypothetical protein LHYA1_G000946 [Lachnellula hyalina]
MSNATHLELIHSYRHMYRALLRGVQFSKPARYVARDQLREAYRNGKPGNFDNAKIQRTLEFLDGAAKETGLEHKILKNLLLTRGYFTANARMQRHSRRPDKFYEQPSSLNAANIQRTAFLHYDMTLAMLNDSMGLCLR